MMCSALKTGLVSVSFRALSPESIIDVTLKSGLESIEWGGDVHVPAGDIERARKIGQQTRSAGLEVACYGSYYRLTDAEGDLAEKVLSTAEALGAPLLRVWAGNCASAHASDAFREEVSRNLRNLCMAANEKKIRVVLEHHGGTLTDTAPSSLSLLRSVNHPAAMTLWQPPVGLDTNACIDQIRLLAPYIRNIHVFSWDQTRRLPLAEGREKWMSLLKEIQTLSGVHHLMMEFVRDDNPAQLLEDAACLKSWLQEL